MPVKMRTCPGCSRRVRFGATKATCWACRQKRKPTASPSLAVRTVKAPTRGWSGEYQARNRVLAALGYRTYHAYLRSPVWRAVSAAVLAARGTCELCPAPAGVVHHNRYTLGNLTGADTDHLHALCRRCHQRVEYGRCGKKMDLPAVRARFAELSVRRTSVPYPPGKRKA